MSWGLVCDTFYGHRKAARAGFEAVGLWTAALSWSRAKGTGGHIPADRPGLLAADEPDPEATAARCVARLVKARLWDVDPAGDGWRFHNWSRYQESAEDEANRKAGISAARAAAGAKGGRARVDNLKQNQANEASATFASSNQANQAPPPPLPSPPQPSPSRGERDTRAPEAVPVTPIAPRPPGPVVLPPPAPGGDLFALAQTLAEEGNDIGKSALATLTKGHRLTPRMREVLASIRDKRAAQGQPVGEPAGPPKRARGPTRAEVQALEANAHRHGMSASSDVEAPPAPRRPIERSYERPGGPGLALVPPGGVAGLLGGMGRGRA